MTCTCSGYWVDTTAIAPACERAQRERVTRAQEIVERLSAQGVPVTLRGRDRPGGRCLLRRSPAHREGGRRAAGGHERLLRGVARSPARRRSSPGAGRTPLRRSRSSTAPGGSAVLAHPFWDMDDPNEVAALIDDLDIDGVECFYPAHDRAQTKFLLDVCRDRGLAATASSDFHGPSHKMFDSFCAYPTYDLGEPELPPRRSHRLGRLRRRDQLPLLEQREDLRGGVLRRTRARCRGSAPGSAAARTGPRRR